jgi:hypothetical protein
MRLGTKLITFLVTILIVTMLVHGYLSIQQDRENIVREMKVGMTGLSRSIQAALRYTYGAGRDINATQRFIDEVGRVGNIHGIIVYDSSAKPIAISASLRATRSTLDWIRSRYLTSTPHPAIHHNSARLERPFLALGTSERMEKVFDVRAGRRIPSGPLLPAQRHTDRAPAIAGPAGGYPCFGRTFHS